MISIILSAYNAEQTITRAIDSIINQTYKDWELIIVNDCSTDNTESIIKSYDDKRIIYIKHEINKGAGCSRGTGIEKATGEYVAFLDSDDYYAEDCIEQLVKATNNGEYDIISPGYIAVYKDKEQINKPQPKILFNNLYEPAKELTLRFLSTQLVRRSLFNTVKYSNRRFVEDSPTLIQLLYVAKSRRILDYAGYYYTQNQKSLIHSSSPYKYLIYNLLCAKDSMLFFEKMGQPQMFNFQQFLIKFLNTPITTQKEDNLKAERQELLQFINEQFNKIL